MSDSDSSRRSKTSPKGQGAPLFQARHQPLPPPPQPIRNARDPFDDPPELRPRTVRRSTATATPLAARPLIFDDEEHAAPASAADKPLVEITADLHRIQMIGGQARGARPAFTPTEARRSILELVHDKPWLVLIVGLVCIVIVMLASTPGRTIISRYNHLSGATVNSVSGAARPAHVPEGEHSVIGDPTINVDDVEAVLRQYGSPAAGTGHIWIELGKRYGIDPAYALAFFIQESSAGTNPRWDGLKPDGNTTHNIGNVSCAGYPRCLGRWRDYGSWQEGIEDWYRLIADEYVAGRNISTVEQIIPIYAPSFENDVDAYIRTVVSLVDGWRKQGVRR